MSGDNPHPQTSPDRRSLPSLARWPNNDGHKSLIGLTLWTSKPLNFQIISIAIPLDPVHPVHQSISNFRFAFIPFSSFHGRLSHHLIPDSLLLVPPLFFGMSTLLTDSSSIIPVVPAPKQFCFPNITNLITIKPYDDNYLL